MDGPGNASSAPAALILDIGVGATYFWVDADGDGPGLSWISSQRHCICAGLLRTKAHMEVSLETRRGASSAHLLSTHVLRLR